MMLLLLSLQLFATPAEDLVRGRTLYEDTLYPDAVAVYDDLLANPHLTPAQRQEALLYLGFSQIGLKHEDSARRCFRELLVAQPDAQLPPYTSPKIKRIFEDLRAEVLQSRAQQITPASTPVAVVAPGVAPPPPALVQSHFAARHYWWLWTGISVVGAAAIVTAIYFVIPKPAPYGNLQVHFQVPP